MKKLIIFFLLMYSSFVIAEVEPNNTILTPNSLGSGGTTTGRIGNYNDLDWYKVIVPVNSALNINLSLIDQIARNFPYNSIKWKMHVYNPKGKLIEQFDSDLTFPETFIVRAEMEGEYYLSIQYEGFFVDLTYEISIEPENFADTGYSDFSGIWNTGKDIYLSIHQSADEAIVSILYDFLPYDWDVQSGTVINNEVFINTLYGAENMSIKLTMTAIGELEFEVIDCEPISDDSSCKINAGDIFSATRILQ